MPQDQHHTILRQSQFLFPSTALDFGPLEPYDLQGWSSGGLLEAPEVPSDLQSASGRLTANSFTVAGRRGVY